MRIQNALSVSVIVLIATALWLPRLSYAFFPEIKNMHAESQDRIEDQRNKFRQDVLEKRKEFLQEWRQKKQGIKARIEKGKERATTEFNQWRENAQKEKMSIIQGVSFHCCDTSGDQYMMPLNESTSSDPLYRVFGKSAEDMLHIFSPLTNL